MERDAFICFLPSFFLSFFFFSFFSDSPDHDPVSPVSLQMDEEEEEEMVVWSGDERSSGPELRPGQRGVLDSPAAATNTRLPGAGASEDTPEPAVPSLVSRIPPMEDGTVCRSPEVSGTHPSSQGTE